jgi:plasmid stabilization system protein ParE
VGLQPQAGLNTPDITPTARRDIKAIWRYIARDSVYHAGKVAESIVETCYAAAEFPRIGHTRPDVTRRDVLFVPVRDYERYVIAYAAGSGAMTVLRVVHGARNLRKLFR